MPQTLPAWLAVTLATVGGLYLVVLGGLYALQHRLIYFPDVSVPAVESAGDAAVREIRFTAEDGLRLLAWYRPPAAAGGPVVLYFHGNAGHIGYRAPRLRQFAQAGLGVMMPEYRGYGGNPGTPSEAAFAADARAALALVHTVGTAPQRVVLYGESLGSAVALRLAAEHRVAALVLESPFESLGTLASSLLPWAPVRWLLRDRFDNAAAIPRIGAPVLVIAGARDTLVPPEHGRRLHALAPDPKTLWIAPYAGHNDLAEAGAIDRAIEFIAQHAGFASR